VSPVALTVVIPVFDEEAVLPLLAQRLRPVLDQTNITYEVLAVDDGSRDATPAILYGMRRTWPELRVIRLHRNCGHQAALTAGLHHARGSYVVSIDADLQDPPEKIVEMLAMARAQGLDVVYGIRTDRNADSFMKRSTAAIYYRLMRRIVGNEVPAHGGDFRLLSRAAVEAIRGLPNHQPVYRLLVPWLGFPSGEVTYTRERRAAGSTKYPLPKMIRLAWDSVTNFSPAPLRLATTLGVAAFVLCALAVVGTTVSFALGKTVSGWTSLIIAVLFLGAVQLICLGLLGEYVGRIYTMVQQRPAYVVAGDSATDAIADLADLDGVDVLAEELIPTDLPVRLATEEVPPAAVPAQRAQSLSPGVVAGGN
jgi:dolichol-phosphate mannosyltransferase